MLLLLLHPFIDVEAIHPLLEARDRVLIAWMILADAAQCENSPTIEVGVIRVHGYGVVEPRFLDEIDINRPFLARCCHRNLPQMRTGLCQLPAYTVPDTMV